MTPSSRRKFLLSVAPTLFALRNSSQAAGALSGKIKLAVKYPMIKEPALSTVERFRLLKEIGFDGVELRSKEKAEATEFIRARDESGLAIHGVVNSDDPDISSAIELAKRYGADSVLIVASEDKAKSFTENSAHWQSHIRKAIPLAEKHEVRICIENVRATFLKTGKSMVEFIDSFETEIVRSYFDLGNAITWTEQSAEHWAKTLGDRIYKLDIKDRGHPVFGDAKRKREGITTGTNGGEVNWESVRTHLEEIEFTGWATAEVKGGDRKRLTEMRAWMRDVLDLV